MNAPSPAGCPSPGRLRSYREGSLPASETDELRAHVASCQRCSGDAHEDTILATTAADRASPHAPLPKDRPRLPTGTRVGRYVVLEHAGSGGMGEVYAAYDPQLDRRVALKLLGQRRSPRLEERLLREAKAMAQLAHPNVVPVHDAGESHAGLFVAMSFVEGQTLRAWLSAAPRTWREIVTAFAAAGRGLAAAHAAGIVHRDFKPDNVLIDGAGHASVTDFGLARLTGEDLLEITPAVSVTGGGLTQTGALVGTPQFMAPEQLAYEPADARSDLFAFCVSLYAALHGQHPFLGARPSDDMETLRLAVSAGVIPEPAGTRVPRRIRQVMLRGLRANPAERPPSMDAVLAVLDAELRPRRRLAFAGLTLVAASAAALVSWRASAPEAPPARCRGAAPKIAEIWNPAVKARTAASFARSGKSWAPAAYADVERGLEGYFASWTAQHTAACEATAVRREQSEAVLDLRIACLERLRSEARALIVVLSTGEGTGDTAVDNGARAVASLPPVEMCGRVDRMLAAPALPRDPGVQRRLAEVEALIAQATALASMQRLDEAQEIADAVVAAVRPLGYPPLTARGLIVRGHVLIKRGEAAAAYEVATEALPLAARSRDDDLTVGAFEVLQQALRLLDRLDEAGSLALAYVAAVERSGDPMHRVRALEERAQLARLRDRRAEALALIEEAIALRESVQGRGHPDVPWAYLRASAILGYIGQEARALATARQALALADGRDGGPVNPSAGLFARFISWKLVAGGRYAEARTVLEEALPLTERMHGFDSGPAHDIHVDLAVVDNAEEAFDGARVRLERALARLVAGKKGSTTLSLIVRLYLIDAMVGLRRFDEAGRFADEVLAIMGDSFGPDATLLPDVLLWAARARVAQGRERDADEILTRGLAVARRQKSSVVPGILSARGKLRCRGARSAQGLEDAEAGLTLALARAPDDVDAAEAYFAAGECRLVAGRAREAAEALERALALRLGHANAPRSLAWTRFSLARALWRTGGAPARVRARQLATEARAALAAAPVRDVERLTAVDRFLRSP